MSIHVPSKYRNTCIFHVFEFCVRFALPVFYGHTAAAAHVLMIIIIYVARYVCRIRRVLLFVRMIYLVRQQDTTYNVPGTYDTTILSSLFSLQLHRYEYELVLAV